MNHPPHAKQSLIRDLENYKVIKTSKEKITPQDSRLRAAAIRGTEVFIVDKSADLSTTTITDEVIASANAMKECGVFRLPASTCYFEFAGVIPDGFDTLVFEIAVIAWEEQDDIIFTMYMQVSHKERSAPWAELPYTTSLSKVLPSSIDHFEKVENYEGTDLKSYPIHNPVGFFESLSKNAVAVITNMIVWLATPAIPRGRYANGQLILKDRPEPKYSYTVVELNKLTASGHMSSKTIEGRQKVRLHLRRGHVRNQPYGPGRTLIKKIYVEAHLVGYEEQGVIVHDYKVR